MSDYDSDYEERPPEDGVPGFQFNPDTGKRETTTYSTHQEKRWVECYELIGAGLFEEALEKWKMMIDKDGQNADTQNFQAKIKAGLKASKKKGQASK